MRCGCDLVQVSRIAGLLERREGSLERLFSDVEVADACRDDVLLSSPVALRRLAARWAAKEAVVKALDRPDLGPRDIEVRTLPSGAPELWVLGQRTDLAVSLTHDGDLAMALVVTPDSDRPPAPTPRSVSSESRITDSLLTQALAPGSSPRSVSSESHIRDSLLTEEKERTHAAR